MRSKRTRLAAVAVLSGLSCLPFLRSIFWLADEGVLLQGAERLLQGQRLYRDFFEFLPPGGFLLTAGWFELTSVSFFSARVLATFTFIGIACVLYSVTLRVSCNTLASTVGVVVFVVTSQGLLMQVSHHWFTTLFCISAMFGSLIWIDTRRLSWVILAGLAGGAATMITPTRGALAVMAGLLALTDGGRLNARALTHYVVAVAVVPMLLIVYAASQGSLSAAFDDVIVYPAVHYANIQSVPYGFGADAQNIPLNLIFPVAAGLATAHIARDWGAALRDRTLHVCGVCVSCICWIVDAAGHRSYRICIAPGASVNCVFGPALPHHFHVASVRDRVYAPDRKAERPILVASRVPFSLRRDYHVVSATPR